MPERPGPIETVGVYRPLLGTDVEVRVGAADAATAALAEEAAVAELVRAQRLFSVFDSDSALRRWRSGRSDDMPAELAAVLAAASSWHARTGGAFHPATAALRRRWERAELEGLAPTDAELAELAAEGAMLPYAVDRSVDPARIVRLRDCRGVDLNAIAKGYAADLAVAAAAAVPGVHAVTVNAGGDVRHTGVGSARVGVEDPARPAVNAPRLAVVEVARGAAATSGSGHRWFDVGGRRLGHVLDPRTGWPVAHTVAATVLAGDAATADALATALVVTPPREALALADGLGIAALLVVADARPERVCRSRAWPPDVR